MLSQCWSASLDLPRCPSQPHLYSWLLHASILRVVNLPNHLARDGMLVDEPFVDGLADCADATGIGDVIFPLLGGPLLEHVLEAVLPHGDSFIGYVGAVEVF